MDGRQRIALALARQEPDAVPIWELAFNEPSIIGIARHFMDHDELPELKPALDMTGEEKLKILQAMVAFVKGLDLDGVTAMSMTPKQRLDQDHVLDDFGVTARLSPLGEPHPVKGPINQPDDLKSYRMRKPADGDFLMLDVLKAMLPGRSVAFDVQGPFRLAWGLRGSMEKFLMDFILNPGFARELMRMTTDYILEAVDRAFDKGADWLLLDGDLAFNAGPLMSPAHYREFIGPRHREIADLVHRRGSKIVKHSDGNLLPLFPGLLAAGMDGVHPLQPQNMDIGQVKKDYGDRLSLVGNIDCSFLLVSGTESEIRQNVRDTIRIAAPGGGYIISSSNTIHPGVKPENYLAMARAAREFGRYPVL